MRHWLSLSLLVFCVPVFASFELFDKSPVQGILREGAQLLASGGQDGSGALQINGAAKTAQYGYAYRWEKVEPGQQYGISFAYHPSDNFQGSAMVVVNFATDGWKFDSSKVLRRSIPVDKSRWRHQQVIFTVPDGFTKCEALIRLDKVPQESHLLVDNLRVANVTADKGFFKARFLDTIFDNWMFLGQQHFEHYSLGSGAKVVMDWKQAKAGESFLEIHGDGSKMQYPLVIYNLAVEPDRNYRFSCWYKASKHFSAGIKLFMFECMDAQRKHLDQPRVSVKPTNGEWKELVFDFKTPAKAALLDIMFNMRLFPEDAVILFDQLKFEEGTVGPDLRQSFVPSQKLMHLACPVLGDLGDVSPVRNTYEIRRMDDTVFRTLENPANETLTVKLDDYPDGEYMLHAKVALSNGQSMLAEPRHFGIYKEPYWANNKLGILANDSPAPAPWRNLTRLGNTIKAWNGEYRFNDKLELEQITGVDGQPLLKRGLSITVDGQSISPAGELTWKDGTSRMFAHLPVTFQGRKGALAMIMDYMGFASYFLTLAMPDGVESIVVSYAVNDTEFVHRSDGSWSNIGAIDLKVAKQWETTHRYHEMMLGNVDRGIAWYSPAYYPAENDFKHTVTKATLDGDFSVRLVNSSVKWSMVRSAPFAVAFAVMPWPFRPSAGNWRKLRFRAYEYTNFNMMSSMKPMKYVGLPASKNDAETMRHAQKLQEPGAIGTLYQIPFYITDTMPEYRYFESEWQGFPARYYVLKNFGKNAKMRKCDMRNTLWQDLYCYMCVEYLKKFPWRGFYYDCYGSDLLTVNGENFHPTFDTRKFHERIFLTTNQVHPGFFTFTHAGGQQACTSAGFTDVTLMGEQYRAQCMLHSYYLEFLTLDQFRYENAVCIGPDRMFLPQYRQPDKIASPEIAASTIGLAFLHNCMLYPSFINADICKRMICWLYDFGLEDASFFPYWKPNPAGATTGDKDVPISYWTNAKGTLATVLNATKDSRTVKVTLPGKPAQATLLEPLTGLEKPFASGQELTLPPYQAVLIRILR